VCPLNSLRLKLYRPFSQCLRTSCYHVIILCIRCLHCSKALHNSALLAPADLDSLTLNLQSAFSFSAVPQDSPVLFSVIGTFLTPKRLASRVACACKPQFSILCTTKTIPLPCGQCSLHSRCRSPSLCSAASNEVANTLQGSLIHTCLLVDSHFLYPTTYVPLFLLRPAHRRVQHRLP
jgi:hypothetical protein